MSLDTNTNLKAAIADWLNRSDLTTQIVDFITLTEANIAADLKSSELVTTTTLTVDAQSKALPADFAGMVYIKIQGDYPPLDYMTPDAFWAKYATYDASRPVCYTIQGNTIYFGGSPDQTYTADYSYIAQPNIATDSTNRILVRYPNLYLYGALAEAYSFLGDDQQFAKFKGLYNEQIQKANESDQFKGALQIIPGDMP